MEVKPCPGCGGTRIRMFSKTVNRGREPRLIAMGTVFVPDIGDGRGDYEDEREYELYDFKHGFYYRCNKCGWRSPTVFTPWHVRTEEDLDSFCPDEPYFGFEATSEWARPARDEALEKWNERFCDNQDTDLQATGDDSMGLKPCPFCGRPASLIYSKPGKEDRIWAIVRCDDIECIGSSLNTWYATEEDAIKAWNKRYPDNPLLSNLDEANIQYLLNKLKQGISELDDGR